MKDYEARELWETFEYFSGYGFNKSHAVSYCVLSYQCAYLLNYHPSEWLAAFFRQGSLKQEKSVLSPQPSLWVIKLEPLNVNTSLGD